METYCLPSDTDIAIFFRLRLLRYFIKFIFEDNIVVNSILFEVILVTKGILHDYLFIFRERCTLLKEIFYALSQSLRACCHI